MQGGNPEQGNRFVGEIPSKWFFATIEDSWVPIVHTSSLLEIIYWKDKEFYETSITSELLSSPRPFTLPTTPTKLVISTKLTRHLSVPEAVLIFLSETGVLEGEEIGGGVGAVGVLGVEFVDERWALFRCVSCWRANSWSGSSEFSNYK
jgi:hypothetical protein